MDNLKDQLKNAEAGQQTKFQITPEIIKNARNVECECGGVLFSERNMFKKISAILSPSGKEELVPIPVLVCDKCGKVPSQFDPQNILPSNIKATKLTIK